MVNELNPYRFREQFFGDQYPATRADLQARVSEGDYLRHLLNPWPSGIYPRDSFRGISGSCHLRPAEFQDFGLSAGWEAY